MTARLILLVLAVLASAYVFAVAAWLWTLRDGVSGPNMSTGLVLVGAAVLVAWLGGITGAGRTSGSSPQTTRTWRELRHALRHLTGDPLGILRAGMTLQLAGFAVLVLVR